VLCIALCVNSALFMFSCAPAEDTTDDGGGSVPTLAVTLEAQPWSVPADGSSRIVLFAECRIGGTPVADSTEVIFLNTIGTLQGGVVLTRSGVALDTLVADSTAALGYVIAYCEGMRDTVEIMFIQP
jgi:hypothetical protein